MESKHASLMRGPHHSPYSRDLQQRLFLMLQRCSSTMELSQLHAQLLINGFSHKKFIVAKLLSSCIATGNLAHATQAFDQVAEPTTTLFNQMIRAAGAATLEPSLILYNQMRRRGVAPSGFTYSFLFSACARTHLMTQGEQLQARIVSSGFGSNVFVQTTLLNMYAAAGGDAMENAQKVFDEMPQPNIVSWNSLLSGHLRSRDVRLAFRLFEVMPERDVVSWTTMIAGCVQAGRCTQALALFHDMRRSHVSPDEVTMVSALSACADLGDLELGRWIHACVERCHRQGGRQLLVSLNNSLIHMYSKCGDIEEAQRIFREMPQRSTITWTTIIAGLAIHGRGDYALDTFQKMQCMGETPDEATFVGVLCACSHTGRIDDGRHYFKHMIEAYQIRPRIEHYGCMVDMLSRAGHLSEARELIDTMPLQPNEALWGALLGGCRMYQDVELASNVANRLIELTLPDHMAGYLVLLSNSYSAARRWDDVRRVREVMVEMGLSKPAGSSWMIQHDFMVDAL